MVVLYAFDPHAGYHGPIESDPSLLSQSTNFLKILEHLPRRTELVSLGAKSTMGRLELERQTNARVENDPLRARGSEMAMRRFSAGDCRKGLATTDAVGTEQDVAAFRRKKKKKPDELEKL